jgi:hypothetical protein
VPSDSRFEASFSHAFLAAPADEKVLRTTCPPVHRLPSHKTQYSVSPERSRKIETPEGNLGNFTTRIYPKIIREIQQQSKFADYGSEGLGFESLRLRQYSAEPQGGEFAAAEFDHPRDSAIAGRGQFCGAPRS